MSTLTTIFAIAVALLVGAASPGPSFLLVSHTSITHSRRAGLLAALGMGTGALLFATLALAGLAVLITKMLWLHTILQVGGGIYLVYMAWKLWSHSGRPLHLSQGQAIAASLGRVYLTALFTQISNPKTAIVYASIFAALLPNNPDRMLFLLLPIVVFTVEAGWYGVVAVVFSAPWPRRAYLGAKKPLDRFAALVLGGLGFRLVFEGVMQPLRG